MSAKFLSIDIGTGSVRSAILNSEGKILSLCQLEQPTETPHPGWAQQPPARWWKLLKKTIPESIKKAKLRPGEIKAIAVCGQMHAPCAIDKSGKLISERVQLWCDKRCQVQVNKYKEKVGEELGLKIAANPLTSAWVAFKIRWVKENEPQVYRNACKFVVPKDFINFKLTGKLVIDPSEASMGYTYDWKKDNWSQKLADRVGIDYAKLPDVYPSDEIIGEVSSKAAKETGLKAGTPVVTGGGDFPVALLGVGVVEEGLGCDVTGTSMIMSLHSDEPIRHRLIQNLRAAVDGWIPFAILDFGGVAMKWARGLLGRKRFDKKNLVPYGEIIRRAGKVPPGSDGLFFYPYLTGERFGPNARSMGAFWGMLPAHTLAHFFRAVMEGTALASKMNLEIMESCGIRPEKMHCIGGGARNDLWQQIKADIYGVPLSQPVNPEGGLLGNMLLAASGIGLFKNIKKAAKELVKIKKTYRPDKKTRKIYQQAQKDFERFYDAIMPYWQG